MKLELKAYLFISVISLLKAYNGFHPFPRATHCRNFFTEQKLKEERDFTAEKDGFAQLDEMVAKDEILNSGKTESNKVEGKERSKLLFKQEYFEQRKKKERLNEG